MTLKILKEIKNRKSPLVFKEKDIEKQKVASCIEAARWAPSCFNNQPWKYVLVHKNDQNRKIVEKALTVGNGWAKKAPYLVIVSANTKDDCRSNKIDYSLYDTGLSVMSFAIEAQHQGLYTHQMAGFKGKKMSEAVNLPSRYKVVVVFAFGYKDNPKKMGDKLTKKIKNRLTKPRTRKPIKDNFFFGEFNK